jgi:methionyl-tRNA formyltransferase
LRNTKKIYVSLIEATKEVDAGYIYLRDFFMLKGYELFDEIRYLQAQAYFQIIKKFLIKYPNIKSKPQKGRSNFNLRRRSEDSEININKSIKSQFNLLRICDNELYPAFFKYKKNKYILKIYHNKEE